MRDGHPHVPWRQIFGMRNRLAHDYLATDLDIVWAAATQGVPEVAEAVRLMTLEWAGQAEQPRWGQPDTPPEADDERDESE